MSESVHGFALGPGSPAPQTPFLDAAQNRIGLSELLAKTNKLPLLLVFFKVDCPTCQLAWPYLQRLHALYGGRAVRVAGVCQNSAAEGAAHYRDFGHAAFDLLVDPEPGFVASNAFGVEAVPHFVLVSHEANVTKVFAGWSKREMETLAGQLAHTTGLAGRPFFEPGDPVKEWQAG
jgi:peroxiredoxin